MIGDNLRMRLDMIEDIKVNDNVIHIKSIGRWSIDKVSFETNLEAEEELNRINERRK